MNEKLIAIDGNSLMHRAYHALPAMTTRDGVPTGALHGFLGMLIKLVMYSPTRLVVAFDMHAPTFRHKEYSEYKAGRRETDEDLRAQFPLIKQILELMHIYVCECEGFEADDILGTYSRLATEKGIDSLLVTGDRDALQLVDERVHVLLTKKGISETVEYDPAVLFSEYGLAPSRMVDLKGLMGDSSDNLPGVFGVGEKTALKLLAKYGTMENALESGAREEKGALQKRLTEFADNARLSYRLGTIVKNAPIENAMELSAFDMSRMRDAIPELNRLQLKSISERLTKLLDAANGSAPQMQKTSDSMASTSDPMPSDFSCTTIKINDIDELKQAVADNASALFAFDIGDSISFAFSPDIQYELCTSGTLLEPGLPVDEIMQELASVFSNNDIKKVAFDAKTQMHKLDEFGIELKGLDFDTMIADSIINAANPAKSISQLCTSYSIQTCYTAAMLYVCTLQRRRIEEEGMLELYYELELPLINVLYDMEVTGFCIDKATLLELGRIFTKKKAELEAPIFAMCECEFNILSPKQLSSVLFEKLMLPPPGKKTAQGYYSTAADVLETIAELHPVIPLISEYRFVSKLKGTYIDGMLPLIDKDTGRLHTTFNQNVSTGRISSAEPNLQNIPVRTELGREIRRAFVASAGNVLVDSDYSQIELRILAHMSQDATMTRIFSSNGDIHTQTAAEIFDVPVESVTREMRSAAKAVNFGIVYGISDFGLAKNLNISRANAKAYITAYLEQFGNVGAFMQDSIDDAKRKGYAETLLKRRRALPELRSPSFHTRSFGERVARNMPIQGSAADIIKLAMIAVHSALKERGLSAKLVLQIHDELIIDTPIAERDEVCTLLAECMSNVMKLSVPLVCEVCVGNSWYEAK